MELHKKHKHKQRRLLGKIMSVQHIFIQVIELDKKHNQKQRRLLGKKEK
jgi:hypothetical protein